MKRVAIYARYSSDMQKPTSIADQIDMARRTCERNGWTVVAIFEDHEMTGRRDDRPGYQNLLKAADDQAFDVIVVEAIDRLSRKVTHALQAWELIRYQQIELFSINEGLQNFMTVLLQAYGAQQFSEMIGVHTRRGMQGAISRNRTHTSAYGYDIVEDAAPGEPNRCINPEQADVVRRIFEETAEGKSATAIARGLNEQGIPSPKGGTWDASTIRGHAAKGMGILHNRLYIGIAVTCATTRHYHPTSGIKRTEATPEERREQEIPSLRIIADELWAKAHDQIARSARKAADKPAGANPVAARRNRYLLSGLMVCGCCGANYVKASSTGFKCNEARKHACKNTVSISKKRIESRVFDRIRDAFRSPELLESFSKAVEAERRKLEGANPQKELDTLRQRLRKAEVARKGILDAIETGAPFAPFKARSEEIETEIAGLEKAMSNLQAKMEAMTVSLPEPAQMFDAAIERMEQLLGDPDLVDQASQFLGQIVRRIVLVPDASAQHGLSVKLETDFAALLAPGADDIPPTHLMC